MTPTIVFMGSPEFALPILHGLAQRYHVVGVVTQPDRPAGRGRTLTPPSVKLLAEELEIPVIQPRKLSQPDAMELLSTWEPTLIVVAAFGQILRPDVLNLPPFGCINVHASLLPRWRGAAPIQAAILDSDETTGVTIMCMDPGIDTGPTLGQRSITIETQDTAGSLSVKLATLGAALLLEVLPSYLSGSLQPQPQDDSFATYAPMIKKEHGLLDFSLAAEELERRVRAFNPWPGAYTYWNGQLLKIHRAHIADSPVSHSGTLVIHDNQPGITTGEGILVLDQLQPAGKNIMHGKAFIQGARNWEGELR